MSKLIRPLSVAASLILVMATAAMTQDFPSRPIKIVVPYGPGGATDIVARLVSEEMRRTLGQPVLVENKPGANGILAIEAVATSKPDGYTLMLGNVTTNGVTPVIHANKLKINYEKDLTPIAKIGSLPSVLILTTVNFEPKTLPDVVDFAKKNPGKVRYCSAGVGSYPHFDTELFAKRAGIQMTHIPVQAGAGGILNGMLNGDLQFCVLNVASSLPMVKAGKLRALAVTGDEHLAEYPGVPTLAEAGYPGVGTTAWQALFAPGGTPKDVLHKLHNAVAKALASKSVKDGLEKQMFTPTPTSSPEDAKQWIESELAHWKKIHSELNLKIE